MYRLYEFVFDGVLITSDYSREWSTSAASITVFQRSILQKIYIAKLRCCIDYDMYFAITCELDKIQVIPIISNSFTLYFKNLKTTAFAESFDQFS